MKEKVTVILLIRGENLCAMFAEIFTYPEEVSTILGKAITRTRIGDSVGINFSEIPRCKKLLEKHKFKVIVSENEK